jgi:hypothetical protein
MNSLKCGTHRNHVVKVQKVSVLIAKTFRRAKNFRQKTHTVEKVHQHLNIVVVVPFTHSHEPACA